MAFDRVADNGKGANEILAVESACVDCSAQTGGHRQTTLAHRARLRRIEAGTGPGTLRGPELARVSSSCNAIDRGLRLPGSGTVPFFPLRQLAATPSSQYPASHTPSAIRLHAPRRYPYEQNGIAHNQSLPCDDTSQLTSPVLCHAALVVFADSYNTVVLGARIGSGAFLLLRVGW